MLGPPIFRLAVLLGPPNSSVYHCQLRWQSCCAWVRLPFPRFIGIANVLPWVGGSRYVAVEPTRLGREGRGLSRVVVEHISCVGLFDLIVQLTHRRAYFTLSLTPRIGRYLIAVPTRRMSMTTRRTMRMVLCVGCGVWIASLCFV